MSSMAGIDGFQDRAADHLFTKGAKLGVEHIALGLVGLRTEKSQIYQFIAAPTRARDDVVDLERFHCDRSSCQGAAAVLPRKLVPQPFLSDKLRTVALCVPSAPAPRRFRLDALVIHPLSVLSFGVVMFPSLGPQGIHPHRIGAQFAHGFGGFRATMRGVTPVIFPLLLPFTRLAHTDGLGATVPKLNRRLGYAAS